MLADTGLAVTGLETGLGRPALRVDSTCLRDHFDNRRLARAILAGQHGDTGAQIQALSQDLRYRRHRRGPARHVDLAAAVAMDLAEHLPVGHLPRTPPAHPADNGLLPDTTPAPNAEFGDRLVYREGPGLSAVP
ncbi:MAG TPA: hypothetical protein VGI66_15550 [Streptosporangiaceae bacterium]